MGTKTLIGFSTNYIFPFSLCTMVIKHAQMLNHSSLKTRGSHGLEKPGNFGMHRKHAEDVEPSSFGSLYVC